MRGRGYRRLVAELRIRNMTEELRRELKAVAAREGKTLNELVIELLAAGLGRRRKP